MAGLLDAVTSFVLDQVGNSGEDGGKTASTTDINSNILNSLPTFGGVLVNSAKRNLSDLSVDSNPDNVHPAKHPHTFTASSPIGGVNAGDFTQEQTMVKAMESCMAGVLTKLDVMSKQMEDVQKSLSELYQQGSRRDEQLDELLTRLRLSENKCNTLEQRLAVLEARDPIEGWSPSPNTDVKIKLLGDSNFANKVNFGNTRGTLGGALPGEGEFCAKIEDLPEPEALGDNTDIVIAVGTNNLKQPGSDPTQLAVQFYRKLKSYCSKLPNTHIHINGVLPTTNEAINTRIREFNRHLDDICNLRPNLLFIDSKAFSDASGSLADKFRVPNDELHLNNDGTKMIASRIKFSLRQRHRLPNGIYTLHRARPGGDQGASDPGRYTGGNYRGRFRRYRGSNRGGRGGSGRGGHSERGGGHNAPPL